jgi:M6 family metalloprotease-like protein
MKEIRLIVLIMMIVSITCLYAAWLDYHPVQITQPDGTILDVFATGDEFHNWAHDADGYTIIQDRDTGNWCWGREVSGDVVPTGYPVHLHTPQSLGLTPWQNISQDRYFEKRSWHANEATSRRSRDLGLLPHTGNAINIVIFIKFNDDSNFVETASHYYNVLNAFNDGDGESPNSVRQYFWDSSMQQLNVQSSIQPAPVADQIVAYNSPHPRGYFQIQSASNPIGYVSEAYDGRVRRDALLRDAIAYVNEHIDPNMVVDSNNSGYVDGITFIIRGQATTWSGVLWSHRAWFQGVRPVINGKQIDGYTFNMQSHVGSSPSVIAHELGHLMGMPDFYIYDGRPGTPVGRWCLMASNANPPQQINIYAQYSYLDWGVEIEELYTTDYYTLQPTMKSKTNSAFRINSSDPQQYFVVEYRNRNISIFDSGIPGTGAVVYRVNTRYHGPGGGNMRNGNELYIFRPGGTPTADGNINQAHFSRESGRTSITNNTSPYSFLENGTLGGLSIYDIGSAGETISMFVDFDGPDFSNIRESFEYGDLSRFDWINDRNNPWVITSNEVHHGNFSIASGDIGPGQTSTLELNINMAGGFLHFAIKTSTNPTGGRLRFFINNMERTSWSGETDWTIFHEFMNPGVYRLQWVYQKTNAEPQGQDKVWLDAVSFPDIVGHILYPASNLSLSAIDEDRQITLQWDSPLVSTVPINPKPIFQSYRVFQNNVLLATTTNNQYSYITTGGNLNFHIIADYDMGSSPATDAVNYSQIPLAIPQNLRGDALAKGVRLEWDFDLPTTFLNGFRIVRDNAILPIIVPANQRTFVDSDMSDGTYKYSVRAVFVTPNGTSAISNEVFITNEADTIEPTIATALRGNYPNPFNPVTRIDFTLNTDSLVKLNIYNIKGELVRTLFNNHLPMGHHYVIWNGIDNRGSQVASGVYFYKMEANDFQSVKKMILLK